jgi:hypothetical protein
VGTPGAPHDGYVDALVQALTYLRGNIGASSAQSTAARLRTGDRIASTPGRRASITNSDDRRCGIAGARKGEGQDRDANPVSSALR